MTRRKTDVLIVGAGPTGLGAAWKLSAEGTEWLLCEAAAGPGGLAASVVDDHGFTWDLGGHVQFSHYGYFDDLMDDLISADDWLYHEREAWVWMRGGFVPYPFQLNLHRLPDGDQHECVRGLISAARGAGQGRSAPSNFNEWLDATFGAGIARLFLRPYNSKVWAHPLDQLSWSWIGERVAVVDLARVVANLRDARDDVSWGPNNRFRFPRRNGTGVIWQALAGRVAAARGGQLLYGHALVSLDTANRTATFTGGLQVVYRTLISTMPLDELVRITDLAPELAPRLGDLRHSSTHVIGIALNGRPGAHLAGKCWMYFPERDCPFYRVTVFSRYSPANVPDSRSQWSLLAEVSESGLKPVDSSRVERDVVCGLLNTRLIAGAEAVHHTWHRRLEYGYPTPSIHRDRALEALLPALERRQVYSRGRFGAWKYEVSNQDHSFAQGVECVERVLWGHPERTLHHPERVNGGKRVVAPPPTSKPRVPV